MKFAGSRVAAFLQRPDNGVRAILFTARMRAWCANERPWSRARSAPIYPTRFAFRLTATVLAADPARLADEAAQLSLIGGRRVVRISGAGDGLAKLFGEFLRRIRRRADRRRSWRLAVTLRAAPRF